MEFNNWSLDLLENQVFDTEIDLLDCKLEDDSLYVNMDNLMPYDNSQPMNNLFENKRVEDWTGDDCFDWAAMICNTMFLPGFDSNLDVFKLVHGKELMKYDSADFSQLVDMTNGPFFHDNFREYLNKRNPYANTGAHSKSYVTLQNVAGNDHSECFEDYFASQESTFNDYRSELNTSFEDSSYSYDYNNQDCFSSHMGDSSSSQDYPLFSDGANDYSCIQNPSDLYQKNDFSMDSLSLQESFGNQNLSEPNQLCFDDSYSTNGSASMEGATASGSEASSKDFLKSRHWFEKMPAGGTRKNRIRSPKCWEFVLRLLQDSRTNPMLVKWEDRQNGIFRLVQKETVAQMWGNRTQTPGTPYTYESFARLLRHHYKSDTLMPVKEKQMVYKFGPTVLKKLENLPQA